MITSAKVPALGGGAGKDKARQRKGGDAGEARGGSENEVPVPGVPASGHEEEAVQGAPRRPIFSRSIALKGRPTLARFRLFAPPSTPST